MSETVSNAKNDRFQPYPKYKNNGVEWLEEIPAHWELIELRRRLRDGVDGIKIGPFGSQLKLEDMSVGGFKVYGQANIIKRDFEIGNKYISPDKYVELGAYKISPGDIVISMMGTTGRCQVVPDDVVQGIMDSHLLRIRVDDNIDPHFLELLIDEAAYVRDQVLLAGRGTVMHGLNSSIIKSLRLAIPCLDEQRCILNFLDHKTSEIDTLIAAKERLIILLQEKRAALITHAVTKGLDTAVPMKDSGIEWLGEIPAHWELKQLKRVSPNLTVGIVVNPSTYVSDDGVPFLYGSDIKEGQIVSEGARRMSREWSDINHKSQLHAGDLVTVRVGAPGITAVVPDELEGANCASILVIRRSQTFNSYWLCYTMNSRVVRYQVELVQYGAAQEQFNVAHAVEFLVPLPPLDEQAEIADFLDQRAREIDFLINGISEGIKRFQEYRTALISAAVTGKIDVRDNNEGQPSTK